uniref:DUF4781 domain-containing protein n=1 Tax=Anopheles funestus TaxID=62324 RepID=A0A182RXL2_ANOFN
MAEAQIARIMHDSLHRGVERDEADLLRFAQKEEFFIAKNKSYAVNLLAFALGQLPQNIQNFDQFERCDLLTDRKLHDSLAALVHRMPTLQFQFIPLVLLIEDRLEPLFLLRVQKASNSTECVYLDLTQRKYERFEEFLTNNKFPPCTLWYPKDGLLRYKRRTSDSLMLVIDSCKVKNTGTMWQDIAVAGSAVALLLSFTPLSATVGMPLVLACSATSSGISAVELVDSYKHENVTAVARRAVALAFNLTTFASAGLTAVCRIEKLRKMLPAEKLLQLERAEKILKGTMRGASTGSCVTALIGTVGGWQQLPNAEWIELAAMLCFAYREQFSETVAIRLIDMMQRNGVFKFFKQLCPNVPHHILSSKLEGLNFNKFLPLVTDYLKENVHFTVDDNFTTIYLFGYELQFSNMFSINWEQLKMLLLFVQKSTTSLISQRGKAKMSQLDVNNVVQLLQTVAQLPTYLVKLDDYITLGRGHRFSFATIGAFLTATNLERIPLLEQLASLTPEQTEVLNILRESQRISGGDRELFKWLGQHTTGSYRTALLALISVAEAQRQMVPEQTSPIEFTGKRITVSSLLGFYAEDFLKLSERSRTVLLRDERFLRLCYNADKLLLDRANKVWMCTCSNAAAIENLETVGLLEQLIVRVGTSSANLPPAACVLDYALDFSNTTVSQVYYSIVSAWKQFNVPLDKRMLHARFQLLMNDAQSLGMARYYDLPVPHNDDWAVNDEQVITLSRNALLKLDDTVENPNCSFRFGPLERAACWLELFPLLRNEVVRKRLIRTIITLVTNGTGAVLKSNDNNYSYYGATNMRIVMFATHKDKVLVEVIIPSAAETRLRVSFYMCGNTMCSMGAGS